MGYAYKNGGREWRMVNGPDDLLAGEQYSETVPPVSPEAVTEAAWEHIKARRDVVYAGGVKVDGKWYHTDSQSRIQYLGLREKARDARAAGGTDDTPLQALGQNIVWKTMDGTFALITVRRAEDIFTAAADLDAAAFAVAEMHRAAMEASADPAGYDYSGGWPESYEAAE